jgi:hypothetical protein
VYWKLLYWEAIHWIGNYWILILVLGVPLALFIMGPVYESDFLEHRRKEKFRKRMEEYLNSYVYKINDAVVRQEKVMNNGHQIYDEMVRQEQLKGAINGAKSKK